MSLDINLPRITYFFIFTYLKCDHVLVTLITCSALHSSDLLIIHTYPGFLKVRVCWILFKQDLSNFAPWPRLGIPFSYHCVLPQHILKLTRVQHCVTGRCILNASHGAFILVSLKEMRTLWCFNISVMIRTGH